MVLAAVLTLTVLVLAACGGRADDETAQDAPSVEGVVQSAEETAEAQDIETSTSAVTEVSEETSAVPTSSPAAKVAEGPVAPELRGIVGWVNSEPLLIQELKGKVVLVDFWTYTCVNCIRTFPYLKLWHAKYADDGLVILGVHTPEFDFEKKTENVRNAVDEYGLDWAVAQDNDYATWNAYQNRYWPAKYLIDKDGIIRYTHFGEGAYTETEEKIRELLEEAGADLVELNPELPNNQPLDPAYSSDRTARITRELYGGWERGYPQVMFGGGYVANEEYYDQGDTVVTYADEEEHKRDLIYLQGDWLNSRESLTHGRETTDFEDHIALNFSAKTVNAVIKPEGEDSEPFKVLVTLDGQFLDESTKGADVVIEEDGRTFLYVDEPRLYAIINAPSYGSYELKLSSNSPHFALFAFTFGIYVSGV